MTLVYFALKDLYFALKEYRSGDNCNKLDTEKQRLAAATELGESCVSSLLVKQGPMQI